MINYQCLSSPCLHKAPLTRTKADVEKISCANVSAEFLAFPGSHVAAFTAVLMLAPRNGEVSMASSGGD